MTSPAKAEALYPPYSAEVEAYRRKLRSLKPRDKYKYDYSGIIGSSPALREVFTGRPTNPGNQIAHRSEPLGRADLYRVPVSRLPSSLPMPANVVGCILGQSCVL